MKPSLREVGFTQMLLFFQWLVTENICQHSGKLSSKQILFQTTHLPLKKKKRVTLAQKS